MSGHVTRMAHETCVLPTVVFKFLTNVIGISGLQFTKCFYSFECLLD